MTATAPAPTVGALVRLWRTRRRLSQEELADRTAVSARHLSYVETGRARPSAALLARIGERLDVPLRETNALLLAGGFAPAFPEHRLAAPELRHVSDALRRVLDAHTPYPALVLDRWWDIVDSNDAVAGLLLGVAPHLLKPPLNVLRLSLHPDGLAPRVANLPAWRAHLLGQLRARLDATGDARLARLLAEVSPYPGGGSAEAGRHDVVVPLVLSVGGTTLSLFSLTSTVTTAHDVTVAELVLEAFYPADEATAAALAP